MIDSQPPALLSPQGTEYGENYLSLGEGVDFESFRKVWDTVTTIHGACPWWIGDLINQGEAKYGEKYSQAVDLTNLKYDTLMKYAWVARAIPREKRIAALSFTHHLNVMRAPEDKREALLGRAVSESLSTRDVDAEAKRLSRLDDAIDGESEPVEAVEYEMYLVNENGDIGVLEGGGPDVAVFVNRKAEKHEGKSVARFYAEIFIDGLRRKGYAK